MNSFDPPRNATVGLLLALVLVAPTAARSAHSQPPPPAGSQASPYRPPSIALVQPTAASAVPRDKPIIVFRFASGELDDPIDARSFAITVDGVSRTAGFQVAGDKAWGPLGGTTTGDSLLAPGPHAVSARICSIRGLCANADVTIAVEAGRIATATIPSGSGIDKPPSERARLIARVLDALRRILVP